MGSRRCVKSKPISMGSTNFPVQLKHSGAVAADREHGLNDYATRRSTSGDAAGAPSM